MQVEVRNGDIEGGIRILKNLLKRDGIHVEAKRRNEYANKTDRKKMKALIANRRRIKIERRKAIASENRRWRPYDRDYEIKKFERQHGVSGSVS